jgi:site-specific recombinase XerD
VVRVIEEGTSWGPASRGQALAALRSFLIWAGAMGGHHLPKDVIGAALRSPANLVRRPYQVLTEPEIGALLVSAIVPRDRAVLAVMLGAGLRVSEVVALQVRDVLTDQEGGAALYLRQGKGRRDRLVPILEDVEGAIRAYLAASRRQLGVEGPLFRPHDRGVGWRHATG